jgi:tetratricopeptide (TPR) repeat protein
MEGISARTVSIKDDKQYAESNRILQQGMKISCDPAFYNMTGSNYQLMKDYAAAESYFKKSAAMLPSRLYPYYLLAKLYEEMELPEQACEMAKIVQTKEPKVDSNAVNEMREEMKKICIE